MTTTHALLIYHSDFKSALINILTMDFIISETNKGKKRLLHDGYIFHIDNTLKDRFISWRCCNKKCKGRLKTDSQMTTIIPVTMDHNHDNNERRTEN
jgi:hypothetical protein